MRAAAATHAHGEYADATQGLAVGTEQVEIREKLGGRLISLRGIGLRASSNDGIDGRNGRGRGRQRPRRRLQPLHQFRERRASLRDA